MYTLYVVFADNPVNEKVPDVAPVELSYTVVFLYADSEDFL